MYTNDMIPDLDVARLPPRQHDPPLGVRLHQVRLGGLLHATNAQRSGEIDNDIIRNINDFQDVVRIK